MTETREAYNVAMQPGRELDALVAKVMGQHYVDLWECRYSVDGRAAMQAWAWLEENHPWKIDGASVALMYYDSPSVCLVGNYAELLVAGIDYPHAIALAVVEAGKVLGVIE